MKKPNNVFSLATVFALSLATTPLFAGGETHAVDDFVQAASRWYEPTEERHTVRYCTDVGPRSVFAETDGSRVREAVQSAFTVWYDYLQKKTNRPEPRVDLEWVGACPPWREDAVKTSPIDLFIIVGNDRHPLYEKYHERFRNAAALSIKLTNLESKEPWSKGAILYHPGNPFEAEYQIGTEKFPLTFSKVLEAVTIHEVGHIFGLPEVAGTIMDAQLVINRIVPMIHTARSSRAHAPDYYAKLDDETRAFFDNLMLAIDDNREILFKEGGFYRGQESYREDVVIVGHTIQRVIDPHLEKLGLASEKVKQLRAEINRNGYRLGHVKGTTYRHYLTDIRDYKPFTTQDGISTVVTFKVLDQDFSIELIPDTHDLNSFLVDLADVFKRCRKFHWEHLDVDRTDCHSEHQGANLTAIRRIKIRAGQGEPMVLPEIPGQLVVMAHNMSFAGAFSEGQFHGSRFSIQALERGVFHIFIPSIWDRMREVFPEPKPH